MNSLGEDRPKRLTSSPRGAISDVDLLQMLANFFAFDAVVLIVSDNRSSSVRASWPTNRAGLRCNHSIEFERGQLLIDAGGSGKNALTATAEIDGGVAVRLHCSFNSPLGFLQEWVERALETLVRMFAAQLGADIARNRVADLHAYMAGLVDLSLTLGEELSLKDLLQRLADSARHMFGARYSAIGLLELTGIELGQIVTSGLGYDEQIAIGRLPQDHGILGALVRDAQPVRLEHLAQDSRVVEYPAHHPVMDSFLGVPIVIHNKVLGSLYLTDKEGGPFTLEDEQVATAFALQAAVVIENVLRREVERQRVNMLESLHEIEYAIHATSSLQEALNVLCTRLGEKLGVDRVKTDTHVDSELDLAAGAEWHRSNLQPLGPVPEFMARPAARLAEELWRSVGRRVMDDYLAPQIHTEGSQVFLRYTNARAAVIVPIMMGGRALGSIYVIMTDQPRHWTESEVNIVETIAGFVGRIILEAQYRSQQSKIIERLEALRRQQSLFLATVSHELRTPLTSITGYLELFKDGIVGEFTYEQNQMLDVLDRNTNRLRRLIENVLVVNQSEGTGTRDNFVQVSMRDVVTCIGQELAPAAQSRVIALEIDPGPESAIITGNKVQMESVVANIISNAVKFSHSGGEVSIICGLDESIRRVRITCQDHGIGIPSVEQSQLFTPFYRASNAVGLAISGTGLGLSIVRQIVHDHGGLMRLDSVEGEGTTVVIDLPMAVS